MNFQNQPTSNVTFIVLILIVLAGSLIIGFWFIPQILSGETTAKDLSATDLTATSTALGTLGPLFPHVTQTPAAGEMAQPSATFFPTATPDNETATENNVDATEAEVKTLPTATATSQPSETPLPSATSAPTKTPVPAPTRTSLPPAELDAGTGIRTRDGAQMVFVPAGGFTMGSTEMFHQVSAPLHTVVLSAFWIDVYEVTNAQYAVFLTHNQDEIPQGTDAWYSLDAGGYPQAHITRKNGVWQAEAGYKDFPMTDVSWYGAKAYCQWVGADLPTEAQWEKAARGETSLLYPWGDRSPWEDGAQFNAAQPAAVGSHPKGNSPYAVADMLGNVWEWMKEWYSPENYTVGPFVDPQGPKTVPSEGYKILRGASFSDVAEDLSTTERYLIFPDTSLNNVGFRCALNP